MLSRSPYRQTGRAKRSRPRLRVGFFHARFVVAALVASLLFAIAFGSWTTPRTVRLECTPEPQVALECRASARSIWGERRAFAGRIDASGSPPELLDLNLEYSQPMKGDSWFEIVGKYGHARPTAISERYPLSFSGSLLSGMSGFETKLRAGQPATFEFRTGWGGLFVFVPFVLVGLLALWLSSGRTVVVYEPAEGRVEAITRGLWLFPARRRDLAYDEIEAVAVHAAPGNKGATLYRPAFRLKSKEVVTLGDVGLTTPDRARHFVQLLGKLLERPVSEKLEGQAAEHPENA